MMKTLRILILLTATIFLSSCITRYVNVPLPLPERPVLPLIESSHLQCIDDSTFSSLVLRDRLLQNHVTRLESIIKQTHDSLQ